MRILRKAEFLRMPIGTLFARGKPWAFEQLSVKGESLHNSDDFFAMDLVSIKSDGSSEWVERLDKMLETGVSYPLETDGYGRDGCFDSEDLFLVYELADLQDLHRIIITAIQVESVR